MVSFYKSTVFFFINYNIFLANVNFWAYQGSIGSPLSLFIAVLRNLQTYSRIKSIDRRE